MDETGGETDSMNTCTLLRSLVSCVTRPAEIGFPGRAPMAESPPARPTGARTESVARGEPWTHNRGPSLEDGAPQPPASTTDEQATGGISAEAVAVGIPSARSHAAAPEGTTRFGNGEQCYICFDDEAPLLVGTICQCRTLAVHRSCLEAYLNTNDQKRKLPIDQRLRCSVCRQRYKLGYSVVRKTKHVHERMTEVVGYVLCVAVLIILVAVSLVMGELDLERDRSIRPGIPLVITMYTITMVAVCVTRHRSRAIVRREQPTELRLTSTRIDVQMDEFSPSARQWLA